MSAPSMTHRRVVRVLRVVVAVGLLVVLGARLDLQSLAALLGRLRGATLLTLGALVVALQFAFAERVHALLRGVAASRGAGGRPLTRANVFADWQLSAAYGAVLPSTVGGDVVRAVLLSRYLPPPDARARGIGLLLVDRLVGLAAMCVVPMIFAVGWAAGSWRERLVVVCFGGLVMVSLWRAPALLRWATRLVPARFERVRRFLGGVEAGLEDVPVRARWVAFGWSLVVQFLSGTFLEVAASSWALGPAVHPAIWVGIPTALVLTVLPVSIGGLGFRESLFAVVLTTAGLPAEVGVALGLMWGLQGLLPALAGAALLALGLGPEAGRGALE